MRSAPARVVVLSLFLVFLNSMVLAQVAGQNIDMVSGTSFPGGDPYLQRQNEPSIAVSTRNPEHLLAGANDYRTVDIPNPQSDAETHDAWLGVFTSLDGGETWRSTLLPGYPQDTSTVGTTSPLHNFTVATDPTIRAGTHGIFYYSGLVFNRGSNAPSGVFVATFQDQDNKGNGNDAIEKKKNGTGNPFLYLNANLIDNGTSGQFLDKPWIAVDVPRAGRTATCNINGQVIQSGYVYVFYTQFTGSKVNPSSKIKVSTSTNCGASWSSPQTLSQALKSNQGTVSAIDPSTGTVYVAWRQINTGSNQPDSIQYAYSSNGGSGFVVPPAAYTFPASSTFDQPQGSTNTFRTIDVPALTVDGTGRVWVAFSQRASDPKGTQAAGSRIMITTLAKGTTKWTTPFTVDATALKPPAEAPPIWHQFMPSLAFAYGKVMLAFYDSRWDNQKSVLTCPANTSCTNLSQLTAHHQAIPGSALANFGYTAVFGPSISDPSAGIRHTIDVFGALIDPAQFNGNPMPVTPFQISQYAFWANPNFNNQIEQGFFNPPNLPEFVQGKVPFIGDYIDVAGLGMLPSGNTWIFNTQSKDPVSGATIAPVFHATWTDNRDVVPPPCVPKGSASCTEDWTQYVPPNGGFTLQSTYTSGPNVCPNCASTQPACTLANAGYSGDRNENIYTSRITNGLTVSFRENAIPANTSGKQVTRSYSLLIRNTLSPLNTIPLGSPSFYRVMIGPAGNPPSGTCTVTGGGAGSSATFPGGVCQLDLAINPKTTAARTVTVTTPSGAANPSVSVLVAQIQAIPAPGTQPIFAGLQATAVLNGDPTNPGLVDPDSVSADNSDPDMSAPNGNNILIASGQVFDPSVDGPGVNAPGINSPGINAPGINAPAINAPGINAPGIVNVANNAPSINSPGIVSVPTNAPGITSIQTVNPTSNVAANAPGINAPGINAPGINAPGIVNPEYFSPSITNLQDGQVTDYTWRATNKGNSSSSYNGKEFTKQTGVTCCDGSGNPAGCSKCQLIIHKLYNSPTNNRDTTGNLTCDLTVLEQSITQANISNPTAFTTDVTGASNDGSALNPTLSLDPGQGERLTLRVLAPVVSPPSNIFPFKAEAVGFAPNFNGTTPASLLVTTTVLPVAVVGQNYVGAQLQSVGGVGTTAWSVPVSFSNPVPATLPVTPAPLAVTPLTLNQAGQISNDVVTAAPGTYSNINVQVQDSAIPAALDLQNLTIQVNKFSIASITASRNSDGSVYLKAGDHATVRVIVASQGPAVASGVTAFALTVNSFLDGTQADPTKPQVSCGAPIPGSTLINGDTTTYEFDYDCMANAGNGEITFTATATAHYLNPAADVLASAVPFTSPASMIVDTTPPTLTFAAANPAANAAGWNNTSVSFAYTDADNLSGVASNTPASPVVISIEGKGLTQTVTVTDRAGNVALFTTSPVNIDKTPPVITSAAAPAANAAGWNNTNVTVTFSCVDNPAAIASGVAPGSPTAPIVLSAEGAGQSATGNCTDVAGNTSSVTVSNINIDKTPPTITVASISPAPNAAGWNNTVPVTVTFHCMDALSGVAGFTQPVAVSTQGANQVVPGNCTDVAGNTSNTSATLNIDTTPPTITVASITPAPNAAGWNNTVPVTVSFNCNDALSGVASFTEPVQLNNQGANQIVPGNCTDIAGNTSNTSATVNIDTAPPTVIGSATTASGPYSTGVFTNQPVTVTFACQDGLSGGVPSSITGNQIISGNTVTSPQGTCQDVAGNTGTTTFGPVEVDMVGPAISISTPGPSQVFLLNQPVTPNFSCVEGAGGVDAISNCVSTPQGAFVASPVGAGTFTVNSADEAGNSAQQSTNYLVTYSFTGFQPPLASTSAAQPSNSGAFVQGNPIAFQWQLQDFNQAAITDPTALVSVQAFSNPACSGPAPVNAVAIALFSNGAATGTNTFQVNNGNGQFVFTWDTTNTPLGCYNVTVMLNDTMSYTTIVDITSVLVNIAPAAGAGDLISSGFYLPSYPGSTLSQATLAFSSGTAGTYTFSLTAHAGAYDGPVLGTSQASVSLDGVQNDTGLASFGYPEVAIPSGSTVAFVVQEVSGPNNGDILYSVSSCGVNDSSCAIPGPQVTETNGTTPPLDTFRRNGVGLKLLGSP